MNGKIEINSEVRSTVGKDGAVLLDLHKGVYHSLNTLGTKVWVGLEEGLTFSELLDRLNGVFAVSQEQLSRDIESFIFELEKKRLIRSLPDSSTKVLIGSRPDRGGALRQKADTLIAFTGLVCFDVALKALGFRVFYKFVKRWPTRKRRSPRHNEVRRICAAVDRAANYYFKHAWCLQRSAVGVCLLRLRGFPAELVIGARKTPFYAHAWLEMDGEVLNDDQETIRSLFGVLERC